MVEKVKETIEWSQIVLGFKSDAQVPGVGETYQCASTKRDNVTIFFQSRKSLIEEAKYMKDVQIGGSLAFYIHLKGLMELYEEIKDKVEIVLLLQKTFYGADEFAIRDCNGYVLWFGENSE